MDCVSLGEVCLDCLQLCSVTVCCTGSSAGGVVQAAVVFAAACDLLDSHLGEDVYATCVANIVTLWCFCLRCVCAHDRG